MRPVLVTLALILVSGLPAGGLAQPAGHPARAALQGERSACGADAPDGLILHMALEPDGSPADPPLTLLNPATSDSRPVDVPDPREWFWSGYGCIAVVKTATGAFYVVDGSTATASPLDFLDPADEWVYDPWPWSGTSGERRFGLFTTKAFMGRQAMVVDFAQGTSWDLTPLITERGSMMGAHFSPSGDYLIIDAGPLMDERVWLIPTDDPDSARQIAFPLFTVFHSFDEDEERLLYHSFESGEQRLVIEKIDTGATYLVATDPREKAEYDPYLTGWFLPGQEDLAAVLHADRFALVDIGGAEPVERYVIEGHRPWSQFVAAPSGNRGVLTWKPETIFVDLESEETRVITAEDGTPLVGGMDTRGRWGLAHAGVEGQPPVGYGVVDLETGDYTSLPGLAVGEANGEVEIVWSRDGRTMLLTVTDADQRRHLSLIDVPSNTSLPLVEAGSITVTLSPVVDWAAYAATNQADTGPVREMALVETATGTVTSLGPGLDPKWLGP